MKQRAHVEQASVALLALSQVCDAFSRAAGLIFAIFL